MHKQNEKLIKVNKDFETKKWTEPINWYLMDIYVILNKLANLIKRYMNAIESDQTQISNVYLYV